MANYWFFIYLYNKSRTMCRCTKRNIMILLRFFCWHIACTKQTRKLLFWVCCCCLSVYAICWRELQASLSAKMIPSIKVDVFFDKLSFGQTKCPVQMHSQRSIIICANRWKTIIIIIISKTEMVCNEMNYWLVFFDLRKATAPTLCLSTTDGIDGEAWKTAEL